MYSRKVPKSQKPDPNDYTLYNPHIIPIEEREERWGDFVRVISIDPGSVNYALRVSKRPRFQETYFHPVTEYMENLKFVPTSATPQEIAEGLVKMIQFLKSKLDIFRQCHFVIIERQLAINYRACRFSAATLTFFIDNLTNAEFLPIILEVDPKMKGKMLKSPPGINKNQLKRWSVETAAEICWSREDPYLARFQKRGKRDDIADTITQERAVAIMCNLPITNILPGFPHIIP